MPLDRARCKPDLSCLTTSLPFKMPHTQRVTSPRKREVAGEDGWTRIISPQRKRKTQKPAAKDSSTSDPGFDPIELDRTTRGNVKTRLEQPITVEHVSAMYEKNEKIWLESDSWSSLKEALRSFLEKTRPIKRCIIFGSGSFCGYRDNWVERFDVGLSQLAVLKAVVDEIEQIYGKRPLCYAQEPCYNDLDIEFLKTLGITTVNDPVGFDLVKHSTFAYTAYCEAPVDLATMFRKPAMLLSHVIDYLYRDENGIARSSRSGVYIGEEGGVRRPVSSEQYEAQTGEVHEDLRAMVEKEYQVFETFENTYGGFRLPNLEVANLPFNDQYLYCRTSQNLSEFQPDGVERWKDEDGNVKYKDTLAETSVEAHSYGSECDEATAVDKPGTLKH